MAWTEHKQALKAQGADDVRTKKLYREYWRLHALWIVARNYLEGVRAKTLIGAFAKLDREAEHLSAYSTRVIDSALRDLRRLTGTPEASE